MVVMSTTAAAECRTQTSQGTAPTELGDLGNIDGPGGRPGQRQDRRRLGQHPRRSGPDGFRASMPKVLSTNPGVRHPQRAERSQPGAVIEPAAPGYSAYRAPRRTAPTPSESMGNVVMWRQDTWTKASSGRVKIVDNDKGFLHGHAFTWDRYATWGMFQRDDGAVVSVISTHHMTNPAKFPRQHGKNE